MTVGTSGDHTDVGWVVDGGDDAGCETISPCRSETYQNRGLPTLNCTASFLSIPGLANVNDIDSIRASLPEVRLHVDLQVLGSKVTLSCEEHLHILGGGIENRGKV